MGPLLFILLGCLSTCVEGGKLIFSADMEIKELYLDGSPLELGPNYKNWTKADTYTVPDTWGVFAFILSDESFTPLFRVWTDTGFVTDQLGKALCTSDEPGSDWMMGDYDTTGWFHPNFPLKGDLPEGMPDGPGDAQWLGYVPAENLWCRVDLKSIGVKQWNTTHASVDILVSCTPNMSNLGGITV